MSDGVTVLNMDVACESYSLVMVVMGPNMCITPCAPSPIPMPYPNIADTGKLDPGTEKVLIDGKGTMTLVCKIKKVTGNEPGTQKDITTGQTNGHAFCFTGAFPCLGEGDPFCMVGSMGGSNSA